MAAIAATKTCTTLTKVLKSIGVSPDDVMVSYGGEISYGLQSQLVELKLQMHCFMREGLCFHPFKEATPTTMSPHHRIDADVFSAVAKAIAIEVGSWWNNSGPEKTTAERFSTVIDRMTVENSGHIIKNAEAFLEAK